MRNCLKKILLLLGLIISLKPTYADPWPWGIMVQMAPQAKKSVLLKFWQFHKRESMLYVIGISRQIYKRIEAAANLIYRSGDPKGPIYGSNLYLVFRIGPFPWKRYLLNTIAVGNGISYNNKPPTGETFVPDDPTRLLNYLMFEITFALPKYSQWQLLLRLHHRSGVFGLFGPHRSGSTAIGLGLRYLFKLK